MTQTNNLEKAMSAWGETMPSWVQALAEECDQRSQAAVADLIGYSTTAINQMLANRYVGNSGRIQAAVEGKFMGQTLICPVLGEVTKDICLEKQGLPFAATNAQRVKLYKTCKNCHYNRFNNHLRRG
ncbi:MAG: hypothetical protein LBJ14_05700 [Desulfarculales bacterium]|jgi:hypothetical protein|nr:hypothetical protein [Desulfarculales bacterium]